MAFSTEAKAQLRDIISLVSYQRLITIGTQGVPINKKFIDKGNNIMETYGVEKIGLIHPKAVYRNLSVAQLTEAALRRGEGTLSNTGALVVTTGKYTGRSPNDKFIVDTEGVHNEIAWGKVNRPISREKFDSIFDKALAYMQGREVFVFDGFAGADKKYTQKFRIINELASQNLFIHQLLIRPTEAELA